MYSGEATSMILKMIVMEGGKRKRELCRYLGKGWHPSENNGKKANFRFYLSTKI